MDSVDSYNDGGVKFIPRKKTEGRMIDYRLLVGGNEGYLPPMVK
jgi:hypothetical protein